jgi:tRNA (cytidine/uridine-2'-O-)-methyltransferase
VASKLEVVQSAWILNDTMSHDFAVQAKKAKTHLRLVLFQPDIAANTGTLLRLAACLGVGVDLIEPAGFPMSDRAFRRAGLDYLEHVEIGRHVTFERFDAARRAGGRRLIVLSTRGSLPYCDFAFAPSDLLLLGRESAGVPDTVRDAADAVLGIPMRAGLRSLNVAVAGAMVLGEAVRQTGGFPDSGQADSPASCETQAETE